MNKKAQEEMVGFAIILIIVAVVIVVLLGFMLRKPRNSEAIPSYEIGAFINSFLKYTTSCENSLGMQNMQELIVSCQREINCLDGRESCSVLNSTINELINASWIIDEKANIKGYRFNIKSNGEDLVLIQKGNQTRAFKTSVQPFARFGEEYNVTLRLYS